MNKRLDKYKISTRTLLYIGYVIIFIEITFLFWNNNIGMENIGMENGEYYDMCFLKKSRELWLTIDSCIQLFMMSCVIIIICRKIPKTRKFQKKKRRL